MISLMERIMLFFFSGKETKLIIENIPLCCWAYVLSLGMKVFYKTCLYCGWWIYPKLPK